MARSINQFQSELIRVALVWAARHCRETVRNGGSCIDEIHRAFGRPKREAYCAKFVWVAVEQASQAAGIHNPIPKSAGACDMLTQSIKRGLRVDKTPGIGSIFYRSSKITNSSGHVGIVIDVTATTVRTVEGNNDDRLDDWSYKLETVLSYPRHKQCQRGLGWDFIHIEDAGGAPTPAVVTPASPSGASPSPSRIAETRLVTAGPSLGSILLALGALAGGYFTTQQLRH